MVIKVKDDTAVKDRPKVTQKTRTATPSVKADPGGAKRPPVPPVEVVAPSLGEGVDLFVRGLPMDMIRRLEAERGRRGLRSRNAVAVAVLDKGVPK